MRIVPIGFNEGTRRNNKWVADSSMLCMESELNNSQSADMMTTARTRRSQSLVGSLVRDGKPRYGLQNTVGADARGLLDFVLESRQFHEPAGWSGDSSVIWLKSFLSC